MAELMEQLVEEFGAAVRLVEEETDDGKGDQEQWCLTEVLEKGDGEFNKVSCLCIYSTDCFLSFGRKVADGETG